MKIKFLFSYLFLLLSIVSKGQHIFTPVSWQQSTFTGNHIKAGEAKLFQRNHGMIVGLQRGKFTTFELGGEIHWRKIRLTKPHLLATTANMEYNFGDNVIGYKAGVWAKRGRINLTYGANLVYFTDFDKSRYGIGPSIGFRLLGFHLVNGYNFLAGDKELDKVNTLYISLRYYFPLDNKFTWKKKDKEGDKDKVKEKKKKKKKKEKAKKKKKREKEKNKKAREKEKSKDKDKEPRKKLFNF
jgi:hypothetical protein